MKKVFHWSAGLIIVAAGMFTGCQQVSENEEIDSESGAGEVTLTIQAEMEGQGPETRTELIDWTSIRWLPADEISVFSGGGMYNFVSQNTESAASTVFIGTVELSEENPAEDGWVWALYPYNASAVLANGLVTTTLPDVQTAVAGGIADDLLITSARAQNPYVTWLNPLSKVSSTGVELETLVLGEDGAFHETEWSGNPGTITQPQSGDTRALRMKFNNVCSGLRFSLTKEGIESVTLESIGGEPIAGTFSFRMDSNGLPEVTSISEPSSSITLYAPDGGTFEPGVWYSFVTLPVTLSQGVTFTLEAGSRFGVRTIASSINLKRSAFSRATNMDSSVEMRERVVEVQVAGPDTWVATDELSRTLPTDVREKRSDRKVLMFYSSWHTDHQVTYSPLVNVTGIKWFYPEALDDANHWAWGKSTGQTCFWGEPLFGYYRTTDPWVLRKHAEMLADAGVDAVVFDCTNGEFLWLSSVKAILDTWSQAKRDGVNVPKIAFMLQLSVQPVNERNALRMLYYGDTDSSQYDNRSTLRGFYGRGEYSDLWFHLDGDPKPFIMAYPESLNLNDPSDKVIYNFFTWRPGQPDYVYGDHPDAYGNHQWGWLQDYPQNIFGGGEQMTVGVAQNASDASGGHCFAFNSPNTYGRSYTKANGNSKLVEATQPGEVASFKYGYNFQEQWDRALDVDPHYVFITQWNEWIAIKMQTWPPAGSSQGSYGYPNPPGYSFADQFDAERSRDIEPTANWGDNGDNYYYQLVQNVRRFKGTGDYPNVSYSETMPIDGDFSGWEKVSPDFKHYPGNTLHRNHDGHSTTHYTNTSGRNDFVDARVTRDREYVYFYVETRGNISPRTDARWMRLLINIDREWETGWKGYDFCLNYVNPTSATVGVVSRSTGSAWGWEDAGNFDYRVVGNKMEIRVPRSVLGLSASDKLDFEFKWADNNLEERMSDDPQVTRILSLYVDGDSAPGGRFNFHYKE